MYYSFKQQRKYNRPSTVSFDYHLNLRIKKKKNEKLYPLYFNCREDGKYYQRRSLIFNGFYKDLSEINPLKEIYLIFEFTDKYLDRGYDYAIDLALDDLKEYLKTRESIDAQQAAENKKTICPECPECMEETTLEELDVFGGLCEECSGDFYDDRDE